jgi:CheY-specific phosphatase CheX
MSTKAVLDELLISSTVELFKSRGVDLVVAKDPKSKADFAAVIGFSGEQMRGMIAIGMAKATLNTFDRKDPEQTPGPSAEDWLGESSNQLLGRMKNKLLNYGIVVNIALPSVLSGDGLELLASTPANLWTYAFETSAGAVYVWLEVRVEPGVNFQASSDPEMQGAPEGELLLF